MLHQRVHVADATQILEAHKLGPGLLRAHLHDVPILVAVGAPEGLLHVTRQDAQQRVQGGRQQLQRQLVGLLAWFSGLTPSHHHSLSVLLGQCEQTILDETISEGLGGPNQLLGFVRGTLGRLQHPEALPQHGFVLLLTQHDVDELWDEGQLEVLMRQQHQQLTQ